MSSISPCKKEQFIVADSEYTSSYVSLKYVTQAMSLVIKISLLYEDVNKKICSMIKERKKNNSRKTT